MVQSKLIRSLGTGLSWRFAAVVLLLAGTLIASRVTERRRPESLARPLENIPTDIQGFRATDDPPFSERLLSRLRPSAYLSRTYLRNQSAINLLVAFYEQQKAGESMHSPKACLPASGWEIWDHGTAWVPVKGRKFKVNRYAIQNSGERKLVLYWYQSKRRIIANEYAAKVLLVRDALIEGYTGGSIVRIIVPDKPGGLEQAVNFASEVIPAMEGCFGSTL